MTGQVSRRRFHPLEVVSIGSVSADGSAVAVELRVPAPLRGVFAFTAGRHVSVRRRTAHGEVRRSYSLCSTPDELSRDGLLRIGVRVVPGGVLSPWLATGLAPGDAVEVLPPVGGFGTEPDPARTRRYAAVVAGSGITPVLSVVSTVLQTEPGSTVVLVYWNRSADSAMFVEELSDLKDRHPRRLQLVTAFSRERSAVAAVAGSRPGPVSIGLLLDRVLPPGPVDEWFLCGPPEVVRGAGEALAARGVHPCDVQAEQFRRGPARPAATAPAPAVTGTHELVLTSEGRTSVVRHDGDGPILDAALTVRPELPYSCRTGVCTACRARTVEGAVRMSGPVALSEQDLDEGWVLPCRSTAITPRVVLDFDAA